MALPVSPTLNKMYTHYNVMGVCVLCFFFKHWSKCKQNHEDDVLIWYVYELCMTKIQHKMVRSSHAQIEKGRYVKRLLKIIWDVLFFVFRPKLPYHSYTVRNVYKTCNRQPGRKSATVTQGTVKL